MPPFQKQKAGSGTVRETTYGHGEASLPMSLAEETKRTAGIFPPLKFARLVVVDRVPNLLGRIHNEGALADNRLVDRLAAQDEKRRVPSGFDGYRFAFPREERELSLAYLFRSVHEDAAPEDQYKRAEAVRDFEDGGLPGFQPRVPHVYRGERPRGAACAAELARDNTARKSVV